MVEMKVALDFNSAVSWSNSGRLLDVLLHYVWKFHQAFQPIAQSFIIRDRYFDIVVLCVLTVYMCANKFRSLEINFSILQYM